MRYVFVYFNGRVEERECTLPEAQAWAKAHDNPSSLDGLRTWFSLDEVNHQRTMLAVVGEGRSPVWPTTVAIEATNRCNARCTFCPRDQMQRAQGIMDMPLYERIVRECAALNVPTVRLHNYGESLLDPQLASKVAVAKAVGIPEVNFISNASLLTRARAIELVDAGLDSIIISLDAGHEQAFEATRKHLRYREVVDNIEGLLAVRKNGRPRVSLSFVYQQNEAEVRRFVRHWQGKVDRLRLDNLHNWAGTTGAPRQSYHPCQRLWFSLTVLWDGRVALCCADFDGNTILGDLRTQTIRQVWNGARFREVRLQHLARQLPSCEACDLPLRDNPDWAAIEQNRGGDRG